MDTAKLGGFIANGTLAVCDRKPYLYQSLEIEKKTLIGFSINIDNEEAEKLKIRLHSLLNNTYEWHCLAEENPQKAAEYKDPASVLYRNADAKFYKFKSGAFKTYFALGSNCVLLAHKIVGSAGAGILSVGGLVTPGTYYAYLDRLYNSKNTCVVERTIYKNGEKSDEKSIDSGRLPK